MEWLFERLGRILPRPCSFCVPDAAGPTWVCPACVATSPSPPQPVRACCGRPPSSAPCPCPPEQRIVVLAATRYDPGPGIPAAVAIRALKYDGRTACTQPLAELLFQRVPLAPEAVLVPVPLHLRRLRARGFNQAAQLTRALAQLAGQPMALRGLERIRDTAPQARCSGTRRRQALLGAFRARPRFVEGRTVVLVDDVSTTGATLVACAVALRQAGVAGLEARVVARAPALWSTPLPG